jgi:hypothetical protein
MEDASCWFLFKNRKFDFDKTPASNAAWEAGTLLSLRALGE